MVKLERTQKGWELMVSARGVATALVGSLALASLVWLGAENARLRGGVPPPGSGPAAPRPGDKLVDIEIMRPPGLSSENSGPTNLLAATAEHSVVFVGTTTCPFCLQSVGGWELLRRQLPRDVANLVLLLDASTNPAGPIGETAESEGWQIVTPVSLAEANRLGIPRVPMTLLIDRRGEILSTWLGPLSDELVAQILGQVSKLQNGLRP